MAFGPRRSFETIGPRSSVGKIELMPMLQRRIQQSIRAIHRNYFRLPLPNRLGIYFHSVVGLENRLDILLRFFRDHRYKFADPDNFLAESGNVCFVSFDDNYRSWLQTLPILEKYQARATFYVNSWPFRDRVSKPEVDHYIGSRRLPSIALHQETTLSTAELKEIAAAGHVIGAHTHTHPMLTAVPYNAACEEIRICREELGSLLPQAPVHFAYPYGMRRHFSRSLRRYCRSIGFRTIANAIPCMQYARSRPDNLYRSIWFLEQPLAFNLDNVCIDGRLFSSLTGRSAVGGGFSRRFDEGIAKAYPGSRGESAAPPDLPL
jgi:peptidoglycan/xylan/chitin deacetylase (PgdA/CDA1 family)